MTGYAYPERMARIVLTAMDEVLGRDEALAIRAGAAIEADPLASPASSRRKTIPFESLSRLQESLERAYGPAAGRGTALRIGRACFPYGLREYGALLGLTRSSFRLLPFPLRLREGAQALADLFNNFTDQRVGVEARDGQLLWHILRCPLCWQRQADQPVCDLAVGLLQESLYWLSGGKIFSVEETACRARGDPDCTIRIDRTPIG